MENAELRALLEATARPTAGSIAPTRLVPDAARARPLGPGGHLRLAGGVRRPRGPRSRQRPQLLRGRARGTTASTSPTAAASARSSSTRTRREALPRGRARRRSCGGSSRASDVPAPAAGHRRSRPARTAGGTSIAGRRPSRPAGSTCSRADASLDRAGRRRGRRHRVRLGSGQAGAQLAPAALGLRATTTRPSIAAWRRWLVEDQRFVDGRPDVADLGERAARRRPLTIRGPVTVKLVRRDDRHRRRLGGQADRRLPRRRPGAPTRCRASS